MKYCVYPVSRVLHKTGCLTGTAYHSLITGHCVLSVKRYLCNCIYKHTVASKSIWTLKSLKMSECHCIDIKHLYYHTNDARDFLTTNFTAIRFNQLVKVILVDV